MATKTDGDSPSAIYHRQRSNSDPQPAVEVLSTNTLNADKGKYNTLKEKAVGAKWKDSKGPYDHVRRNGEMKSGSLGANTPPPERKSKFAALGKIFKPWKWKRKKKSEKIEKTVVEIERKISMRTSREELIRKGVLKEHDDSQQNHLPKIESIPEPPDDHPDDGGDRGGTPHPSQPPPSPLTSASTTAGDSSSAGSANTPASEALTTFSSFHTPSMTTVADISPHPAATSITTSTSTVTSAQARPVIVPPVVPPVVPPPPLDVPPQTITLSTVLPDREVSAVNSVEVESGAVHFSDCVNTTHAADEDDDESGGKNLFEAIPASEPDLRKLPRKSALKTGRNGEASPVPTTSDPPTSSLKRPVEAVAMMQTTPRSSPQLTPNGRLIPRPRVTVRQQADQNKENVTEERTEPESHSYGMGDSDSSDDDEIKYRDDDDDVGYSSLAAKVARQDSLARFLSNRPSRNELVEKNIILDKSDVQKQTDRVAIGSKLTRRLSLRPTLEDLEQRNIIHHQTDYEKEIEKEEKKRFLIRKLSFRPSIEELRERKIIKFNDYVELTEAEVYDRRADKPWTRLTPKDKAAIRKELNEFKSKEMEVHEDSKHLTRFHRP